MPSLKLVALGRRRLFFLLFLGLIASCAPLNDSSSEETDSYKRIGYVYRGGDVNLSSEAAHQLTHVNYAFANVTEEGRVVLESKDDSTHLSHLTSLRERTPDLKILLAIGGWTWSDSFSNAALTDSSRALFARTAVELVEKHDLDGLDIDWEYPGQSGEDNVYRPEDEENFTLLLQTVRQHLDALAQQQGRADDTPYLLSIAAGADSTYLEHTNMAAAQKELDYVNLMTYDFHGPWTDHTGHHANLYPPASPDTVQRSAAHAVDLFVEAGVPPEKIILGVPFYGRGWVGARQENRGLYQSYSESRGGLSYDTLANHLVDQQGFIRQWDAEAQVPYLWNPDSSIVITYEDPESIRSKAEFVKSRGLGGMMYWEHNDDDGTLLQATYESLRRTTSD